MENSMPVNDQHRAQQLLDELGETITSLKRGEAIYSDLKGSVRRVRITLAVAAIGLVLDLSLTGVGAFVLHRQSVLQHQVSDNQETIHDAECNLNRLFISSDTPEQRAKAPGGVARYDAQFHVIYQQRIQLGCQPPMPEPVRR